MKISIVGLGWFGSELAEVLKDQHEVSGTHRTELNESNTPSDKIMNADVLVLNIPPFSGQLEWFKSWNWQSKTHVVFISSTSVYGQEEGVLDEETSPEPTTDNAKLLVHEETWIKTFPHYTIIRFGGLLGKNRHPGKVLSGRKNLSAGNHPVNLIHLHDAVEFTKLVIEQRREGQCYNLVAPNHPTREKFYQDYCREHGLPLPEFTAESSAGKIVSHEKVSRLYQYKMKLD